MSLIAGGALLLRLRQLGFEHVFVNSGTDFPPVVEGLLEAGELNLDLPRLLTIPHEHAAIGDGARSLSHVGATAGGHASHECGPGQRFSRRNQRCVRARSDDHHVRKDPGHRGGPLRRTNRTDRLGARKCVTRRHWSARHASWDYELRFPEQVPGLIDRASGNRRFNPEGPCLSFAAAGGALRKDGSQRFRGRRTKFHDAVAHRLRPRGH